MFQSKWEFGLAARDALALRRQVYVEELGMPEAQAFDRYDEPMFSYGMNKAPSPQAASSPRGRPPA